MTDDLQKAIDEASEELRRLRDGEVVPRLAQVVRDGDHVWLESRDIVSPAGIEPARASESQKSLNRAFTRWLLPILIFALAFTACVTTSPSVKPMCWHLTLDGQPESICDLADAGK